MTAPVRAQIRAIQKVLFVCWIMGDLFDLNARVDQCLIQKNLSVEDVKNEIEWFCSQRII